MSLVFNAPTNKNGIIQVIERRLFGATGYGRISNSTIELAGFTAEVNLALDKLYPIIFKADGRWQYDDSNFEDDYPVIYTNLVAGQRDYPFISDETGNLVLDIYKVLIKPSSTANYVELAPMDAVQDEDAISFLDEANTRGVPYAYDKSANAVMLDPIPSANITNGLKVLVNREASYFATSDTTKKPGFAGLFHEYLALVPAYNYARDKSMKNAEQLKRDMLEMEMAIKAWYGRHSKDERNIMSGKRINYI